MILDLQCLLEIFPHGSTEVLRYQNYQIDDIAYDSQSFEYAPFMFRAYPEQKLELSDDSAEIWVRNSEVIRSMLQSYDGLRRAIVKVRHIQLDNNLPDWFWQLQIYETAPDRGYIRFDLRSPTSALVGPLVSRYLNSAEFPELPIYQVQL